MADRGRGGPRQPARPAAVSGPGALSARTDGGAGSRTQPIRAASGGNYGEHGALESQQQGAPLPDESGGPPSAAPAGAGAAPSGGPPGMFGPTNRPTEPITAGQAQPGQQQLTADELLRLMYSKRPSPYLARLLRDR